MVAARIGFLALAVALAAGACASANSNGGNTDSGINPGGPDADPNAPDADPNAPDADPNAPDANPQGTADAASTCAKQPCDLYAQCGCQAGWACDLDGANLATGDTKCRGVSTQGTEASSCTANEGCAAGYTCLGSPGQCRHYCEDDTACASNGPGALCLIQITYGTGGTPVPGATTCTKSCDPTATVQPATCPPNMACHIYVDDPDGTFGNGDERFLTDCTNKPASGGTNGATCSTNSDCAPGFDCIALTSGGTTTNQCKQTCAYPSGACGTGTCTQFNDPQPVVGGTTYGVCI